MKNAILLGRRGITLIPHFLSDFVFDGLGNHYFSRGTLLCYGVEQTVCRNIKQGLL
jgi:hypothetical protein